MWLKKKAAAEYLGIKSTKTLDKFVKEYGLCHVRLPSGIQMFNSADLDAFYGQFRTGSDEVSEIADKIMEDLA